MDFFFLILVQAWSGFKMSEYQGLIRYVYWTTNDKTKIWAYAAVQSCQNSSLFTIYKVAQFVYSRI